MSISAFLIFQSFTAYRKLELLNQKKIIFFTLRKNYAAAFISSKKAILLTDLIEEDKNFQFFVKPALDQLQITAIQYIKWENDTTMVNFIKKDNQLLFYNYHTLLIDKSFNYKQIEQLPKFSAIWLHQNPKQQINNLRSTIIFNSLIIDATNNDYNIEKFRVEANKIQVQHHILKKNNSYLIDLNVFK